MPRRNRPQPRRIRSLARSLAEETRPETTDQMAMQLVLRGLASPLVLGHGRRLPEDVSTSRERHPVREEPPHAGIEGRERVTLSRAETGLRDVDNHTTHSTANEGETK